MTTALFPVREACDPSPGADCMKPQSFQPVPDIPDSFYKLQYKLIHLFPLSIRMQIHISWTFFGNLLLKKCGCSVAAKQCHRSLTAGFILANGSLCKEPRPMQAAGL